MAKHKETCIEPVPSGSTESDLKNKTGSYQFDRLVTDIEYQLQDLAPDESVIVGNCPEDVTESDLKSFFYGFATIVKLKKVTSRSLTTTVCVAQFDSTESASRSKVVNALSLNGKRVLLMKSSEKLLYNRSNIIQLNGFQAKSEEAIYDQLSVFGNINFILKTTTASYILFEDKSSADAASQCDYLDEYPVTIRTLERSTTPLDLLEQIDQDAADLLLCGQSLGNTDADDEEEEGQIHNFVQLLDMDSLDEYLEEGEREKAAELLENKPLLEVGNEEIIVTEDDSSLNDADVAAIEKKAFEQYKSNISIDKFSAGIFGLSRNWIKLSELPSCKVLLKKYPATEDLKAEWDEIELSKSKTKVHVLEHVKANLSVDYFKKQNLPLKPETLKKTDPKTSNEPEFKEKKKHKAKGHHDSHESSNIVSLSDTRKSNDKKIQSAELKHKKKLAENKLYTTHQSELKVDKKQIKKNFIEVHKSSLSISKVLEEPEYKSKMLEKHEKADSCALQSGKQSRSGTLAISKINRDLPLNDPCHANQLNRFGKIPFILLEKRNPKELKKVFSEQNSKHEKRNKTKTKACSTILIDSEKSNYKECIVNTISGKNKGIETNKTKHNESKQPQKLFKKAEQLEANAETLQNTHQKSGSTPIEQVADPSTDLILDKATPQPVPTMAKIDNTIEVEENSIVEPSGSQLEIVNTVEIATFTTDYFSDEENRLVMDLPVELEQQPQNVCPSIKSPTVSQRLYATLDNGSVNILKEKVHSGNLLYLDLLPKVIVKLLRLNTHTINRISVVRTRPKFSSSTSKKLKTPSENTMKKTNISSSEKPHKLNFDRIDSKFLPSGSKLKTQAKLKSKFESSQHKKHHISAPELPITLKTQHLNTSFRIPKKTVKPEAEEKNRSALGCLEQTDSTFLNQERSKRLENDRFRAKGIRENRPKFKERPKPQRQPSPDVFDPSLDDPCDSPPPDVQQDLDEATAQKDSDTEIPAPKARRLSFHDIWDIPKKVPEIWEKPPSVFFNNKQIEENEFSSDRHKHRPENQYSGSEASVSFQKSFKPERINVMSDRREEPSKRTLIDDDECWSPKTPWRNDKEIKNSDPDCRKISNPWQSDSNDISGDSRRMNPVEEHDRNRTDFYSKNNKKSSPTRSNRRQETIDSGDLWDLEAEQMEKPIRNTICDNAVWDDEPFVRDVRERLGFPEQKRKRSASPRVSSHNERRNQSPTFKQFSVRRRGSRNTPPRRFGRQPSRSRSPEMRRRPSFEKRRVSRSPVGRERVDRSKIPRTSRSKSPVVLWKHRERKSRSSSRERYSRNRSYSKDRSKLVTEFRSKSRSPSGRRSVSGERLSRAHSPGQNNPWAIPIYDNPFGRNTPPSSIEISSRSPVARLDSFKRSPKGSSRSAQLNRFSRSHDRRSHLTQNRSIVRERSRSPLDRFNVHRSNSPPKPDATRNVAPMNQSTILSERRSNSPQNSFTSFDRSQSPLKSQRELSPTESEPQICKKQNEDQYSVMSQPPDLNAYSPTDAFDAISSEEECDFANPIRNKNKHDLSESTTRNPSPPPQQQFSTIPKIKIKSEIFESTVEPNTGINTSDVPSSAEKNKLSENIQILPELNVPLNDPPKESIPSTGSKETRSVMEHLKQRAERLKKLEEMKLARQKLLTQIRLQNDKQPEKKTMPIIEKGSTNETLFGGDDSTLCVKQSSSVVINAALVQSASAPITPSMPIMPPLLPVVPSIPPLPVDAPPPPPPCDPPPPPPSDATFNISQLPQPPFQARLDWNNPAMGQIAAAVHDFTKPPPNLSNPLFPTVSSEPLIGQYKYSDAQNIPSQTVDPIVTRISKPPQVQLSSQSLPNFPSTNEIMEQIHNRIQNRQRVPMPNEPIVNEPMLTLVPPEETRNYQQHNVMVDSASMQQQFPPRDPRQRGGRGCGRGRGRQRPQHQQYQRDPRRNDEADIYNDRNKILSQQDWDNFRRVDPAFNQPGQNQQRNSYENNFQNYDDNFDDSQQQPSDYEQRVMHMFQQQFGGNFNQRGNGRWHRGGGNRSSWM
ncbi:serine/arginine repetitive matrix protein 2-like [Uranotaenia lowii]|uniref:serine/arginine repetitive matrix protein 2-like n=1 Tax=Uranotaenia lowii TaxID=190385 RepID=UPI00247A3078|nr:serine/arginine repetitive matrix protein 2-like [Uranotaenia lowii]